MDDDAKRELLSRINFFKGCTDRELRDIASLTQERELPVGAELCRQGDFENEVYLIVDGEADVCIDGNRIGSAEPGEIVGELAMLGSGRRAATLRTTTALRVLALDPAEIDSVLAADPPSASRLTHHPGTETPPGD